MGYRLFPDKNICLEKFRIFAVTSAEMFGYKAERGGYEVVLWEQSLRKADFSVFKYGIFSDNNIVMRLRAVTVRMG